MLSFTFKFISRTCVIYLCNPESPIFLRRYWFSLITIARPIKIMHRLIMAAIWFNPWAEYNASLYKGSLYIVRHLCQGEKCKNDLWIENIETLKTLTQIFRPLQTVIHCNGTGCQPDSRFFKPGNPASIHPFDPFFTIKPDHATSLWLVGIYLIQSPHHVVTP